MLFGSKLKRKYADYPDKKDILEKELKRADMSKDSYFNTICLLEINKVEKQWKVPRENREDEIILDNGYKWLTMYPKNENFTIIAIFNLKHEFVEFYFDIAKKINLKSKVPYTEDLYLDVVLTNKNEVIFLDEDELNDALNAGNISKSEYELAKKTADKIVNKFHLQKDFQELKEKASAYLDLFE